MAKPYHLLLLVLAGPVLYAAGLCYAAASDRAPLLDASCFNAALPEHFAAARLPAAAAMACGAALLLCFTPWWLGTRAFAARFSGRQGTAHVWSLAGNTAMLVIMCFVLRNTTGIGRGSFLAAWLLWTVALAGLARFRGTTVGTGSRMQFVLAAILGIAAIAACLVIFHREVFVQCFNGDGTELDELARSLRQHFLPFWEIEPTNKFGAAVVNPLVTSSYWTLGFQVLLGEGELPTRLPYWVWWLGIYFAAARIASFNLHSSSFILHPSSFVSCLPLALLLLLAAVWYTLYAGYDPYQGDIANPGVSDAMFALWLLLGFDCLRQKDLGGWVAATVAASLLFYAGPVVFVLTAATAWYWQPVPRRRLLRASMVCSGILLGILAAYLAWGWWQGTLSAWYASFQEEWLDKYFHPQPQDTVVAWFANLDKQWFGNFVHSRPQGVQTVILYVASMLLFFFYFVVGCGFIPAIGLVLAVWKGSRWQRMVAGVVLSYLAIILGCGVKNLHYLGPLLPLTVTLWLTGTVEGREGSRHSPSAVRPAAPAAGFVRSVQLLADGTPTMQAWCPVPATFLAALLATVGLAASIWLCWPPQQPTFTLNRDLLGKNTLFRTGDYAEACRWARIRSQLYQRGDLGWQISQHTWVGYAARGAEADVSLPLCVTDGGSPSAGYELVYEYSHDAGKAMSAGEAVDESPVGAKLYCRDPQLRKQLAAQRPLTGPLRFPWVFQPIAPRQEPRSLDAPR